jgi:hypothetical protein
VLAAAMADGSRRFPTPWRADKIPGGYVARDANGQAIAYLYSSDNLTEATQAKTLTKDEARRIATNIDGSLALPSPRPDHRRHADEGRGAADRSLFPKQNYRKSNFDRLRHQLLFQAFP